VNDTPRDANTHDNNKQRSTAKQYYELVIYLHPYKGLFVNRPMFFWLSVFCVSDYTLIITRLGFKTQKFQDPNHDQVQYSSLENLQGR